MESLVGSLSESRVKLNICDMALRQCANSSLTKWLKHKADLPRSQEKTLPLMLLRFMTKRKEDIINTLFML